jgi:hypothetical protein
VPLAGLQSDLSMEVVHKIPCFGSLSDSLMRALVNLVLRLEKEKLALSG